ncbi:hypothetical protein PV328_007726 [Microctonus aethiopoides]|uniref:Uncharacterized protein n=1 Tax=Microctonus aethiopoides TaxID=144406 RepID=A0AA39C9G2_9HYME|nr:hypothetical protein PV328_007726 [Microctonus aethiopoides]
MDMENRNQKRVLLSSPMVREKAKRLNAHFKEPGGEYGAFHQNANLSKNMSDLVQQHDKIAKDVNEVKHGLVDMFLRPSPEVIISGVPTQHTVEPRVVVDNVLKFLDSTDLMSDVLDICQINSQNKIMAGTSGGQ